VYLDELVDITICYMMCTFFGPTRMSLFFLFL